MLLALAFWGFLWDLAGLILAVPLVASLQIVLRNTDYSFAQFASQLLAGQVGTETQRLEPTASEPQSPSFVGTLKHSFADIALGVSPAVPTVLSGRDYAVALPPEDTDESCFVTYHDQGIEVAPSDTAIQW